MRFRNYFAFILAALSPCSLSALAQGTGGASKPPVSPLEALVGGLQTFLGGTPIAVYIVWWLATLFGAGLLVLQVRSSLMKEWSSLGEWRDKLAVIVTSTTCEKGSSLSVASRDAMVFFKGFMLLDWPDDDLNRLILLNKDTVTLVRRGEFYYKTTRALCGPLAFLSAVVIHSSILAIILLLDVAKLQDKSFTPFLQNTLFVIFLWPVFAWILQHAAFPEWRRQLDRLRTKTEKISRQFSFSTITFEKGTVA